MNILSLDLEYSQVFYILPSLGITLGKSIFISVYWLNFSLTIKHISIDYKAKNWSFYSPSMTVNQYPNCAYAYTFEINAFGYMYRKGLFKDKEKEAQPYDNTPGFVHSSWLVQFRPNSFDFLSSLYDMIEDIKGKIEKIEKEKLSTQEINNNK